MKRSRIAAWALAAVMAVSTATAYVPANAAVKVKKVTVASSLSGDKKTVVVAKGKSVKLATTVTVKPNKKANKKVSYSVKNKKIATVTKKGVVKGKKAGTTKVTVTSLKNKKKKAVITVKVMKSAVKKVTMNTKKAALNVGQTLKVKTTVKAGKGACKTLAYTTSKKKVATVSKKGVVKAVGVGSATITAKAIDGSGKKATCKVTVTSPVVGLVEPVNLASMNILNKGTITFALDHPLALTADQISVKKKRNAAGTYNNALKMASMTTADNVNYTIRLDLDRNSYITIEDIVQLEIPALTGTTKSLEAIYKEQASAYTDEETSFWYAQSYALKSFSFGDTYGYSRYAISALPAGLTAQEEAGGLTVKGAPSAVGSTDATMTAVDEFGNTLTKTIHFIVYDGNTLVATASPVYQLIGTEEVEMSSTIDSRGGSGEDVYTVISDPSNIVTNKREDGILRASYDINATSSMVYVAVKAAGTYVVTVRVSSGREPSQYTDVDVVFHVKQGIYVSGVLRDAYGNAVSRGSVTFENNDKNSKYCAYASDSYYYMSKYKTLIEPGVYDITGHYSYYKDSSDCTSSTQCLYAQSCMTDGIECDITLSDLYKVTIPISDYNDSYAWRYNGIKVGETNCFSTQTETYYDELFLKNGTYTLESKVTDWSSGKRTIYAWGNWFAGYDYIDSCKTGKTYTLRTTVVVNNAPVTVAAENIEKTLKSSDSSLFPSGSHIIGAKEAKESAEVDVVYDLYTPKFWEYNCIEQKWVDHHYCAYSFTPSETGSYYIGSEGNVVFYDAETGEKLSANDGVYQLTGNTKYIVGADGERYTFCIRKKN